MTEREDKALEQFNKVVVELGLTKEQVSAIASGYDWGRKRGIDAFSERLNAKLIPPVGGKGDDLIYSIKGIVSIIFETKAEMLGVKV